MKKCLLSLLLLGTALVNAQVLIDDTGTANAEPHEAAALEVRSNDKGLLVPRLDTPTTAMEVTGMIYYDTAEKCFKGYDGTAWNALGKDCTTVSTNQGVYTQNFETTISGDELSYDEVSAGSLYQGDGNYPKSPYYVSATHGYGISNGTMELDFGPVDANGGNSAVLTFRLASFANTSGNGADGADIVSVSVSTDNGTTWSKELEINGNSNARYNFSATGTKVLTYDGDNNPENVTTTGGNDGISSITIEGLPNTAGLKVKIIAKNNSSNEVWVIDDVVITVQ